MRWYRRDRADRCAVLVERNDDFAGVQMQDRPAGARRVAVDRVTDNRPAHFGAMHAQLMRPAGDRFEGEPRSNLLTSFAP